MSFAGSPGANGAPGKNGADGRPGLPGAAGSSGQRGPPGKDGKTPKLDEFYGVLNEAPGEYDRAFTQGKLAVHLLQEAKWADGAQKPFGLPCFLCLSSEGNVLCTRSSIMPSAEEEEERARMESAAAASVMGDEDDTSDGVGEPAWSEGEDPGACLPSSLILRCGAGRFVLSS